MARIRGYSHFSIAGNVRYFLRRIFLNRRGRRGRRERERKKERKKFATDARIGYSSRTSRTDLGSNLSLNQTTFAGTSFIFTPAFSKFSRSEIAKIK